MLDKIIRFSIKNKLIIGLFTIALMGWGAFSLTRLPIDAVPDITNNQVQIITSAPSQSAKDIERLVTFPVEQGVATIPGILEVRSFSRFGLSVVTVVFKDDIDVYWARQQVAERLNVAKEQIPNGVGSPEMAPVTTGLGEIYQYVIHPKPGYEKKYSAVELRTIQDWIVRRQLLGTEGVADVSSFGGFLKQYEISLSPDKLRSMNISINDVFTALEKNNQNTGGAYIDKQPNAYFIRSEGLIGSLDDIGRIVVKNTSSGIPVLIRDVGNIGYGHAVRYGAMTRNNDGEVVGAIVMMLKGANSSKVIDNVKEIIKQIEKTLPEGVVIEPFLDRTKLVSNAIHTVSKNLIEGALIVIFVLVLLLGNLRAGLITASVIPLSMLFAVSLMNVFGVSGNLMSLGAIDFGLIVDGAVIIVEATMHQLALSRTGFRFTQSEMDDRVQQSAGKMMKSAVFGQIIILIVYLPILALTGIEGKMFKPMAQTVSFAILGAFILSLTYVPMMSALFLSKKSSSGDSHKRTISDRLMDFFHRKYEPVIEWAVEHKKAVIFSTIALLFTSLFLFTRLGAEFLPSLDEGDFAVETRVMTGSSLSETVSASSKGAKILLKNFPDEVKEVVGKIGSSEIPTDPMPIEAADMMVILNDRDQWTKAKNKEELADKMTEALEAVPGVTFGFQQPIQMRFNELMTGARQDVVIKVYGEDLDALTAYAAEIAKIVPGVEGTRDLYVEKVTGLPQIVINYNRDQIAKYGLNIQDVNNVINSAFAGQSAGVVFEGEKRFDLVVRLDLAERQSIEDVQNVFVTAASGQQIPLNQLADVSFKLGPNQIQRDDAKRRITIGFNVRGRDVESIVKEIREKIDKQVKFAPGYYTTYGGSFKNLEEARGRLTIAVPVALLLIFILLFFAFGSLMQGILIFTAIPLSAIGGVVALWIRDMPFSISAGIGFIALFGVAVLNGIVLIAEFNRLRKEGMTDLKDIVFKGTQTRLRPVIMTATVASLGFLPMALSLGSGAEVQKPLATVVIGGLITATILTLVVLPCLYIIFERIKTKKQKLHPAVLVVLLLCLPALGQAQTRKLTLDQALSMALEQNKNIQAAGYNIEVQKQLKKTTSDIGKTSVSVNYFQGNFREFNNGISISQSIPFPTVFSAQASLGNAFIKESELKKAVTEQDLIYQVKQVYYYLVYLQSYEKLLGEQNILYRNFARAATIRYEAGETKMLEKVTAESQLNENNVLLAQNRGNQQVYLAQFKAWLNTSEEVLVADTSLLEREFTLPADTSIYNSPIIALVKQQVEIADKSKKVAANKLLPDITFGYLNQTQIGDPLEQTYSMLATRSDRFHGFEVGVSIPLWWKPQTAKVKAAEASKREAQSRFEFEVSQYQSQWKQATENYRVSQNNLEYYRSTALPNADLIIKQADLAYRQGEIGYTEFLLDVRNAQSIKQNYLTVLNEFNQSVIRMEYLAAKK